MHPFSIQICSLLYIWLAVFFLSLDVRVKFEPELYRVSESSPSVVVRLVLLGDTSSSVAVTVRTMDQEAIGTPFVGNILIISCS